MNLYSHLGGRRNNTSGSLGVDEIPIRFLRPFKEENQECGLPIRGARSGQLTVLHDSEAFLFAEWASNIAPLRPSR